MFTSRSMLALVRHIRMSPEDSGEFGSDGKGEEARAGGLREWERGGQRNKYTVDNVYTGGTTLTKLTSLLIRSISSSPSSHVLTVVNSMSLNPPPGSHTDPPSILHSHGQALHLSKAGAQCLDRHANHGVPLELRCKAELAPPRPTTLGCGALDSDRISGGMTRRRELTFGMEQSCRCDEDCRYVVSFR